MIGLERQGPSPIVELNAPPLLGVGERLIEH